MWYGVLGPLTVSVDGHAVSLGGPKQRLVLALLLVDVGAVETPDRLIDGVWGDDPPDRARHTLQAYVSELRRVLDDAIDWSGHGYRLRVDPDAVDSVQFERLVAAGREALADDPGGAAVMLADALGLWRGDPFADLRDAAGLQGEIRRLQQLRLATLETRIAADLALGHHAILAEELETLTREFPFRETFRSQHMIALYRCGRQAEALRGFEKTRAFLAEEMGVDPSPELQRMHQLVLRQDEELEPPDPPAERGSSTAPDRSIRGLELRGVIGQGEATVVHRAYQSSVGREVAVKVIGPQIASQQDFIRRFEAEVQVVAGLEHPHILALYDFWRAPDGAYLVLPWARSGSVAGALDRGDLSLAATLQIAGQTGAALSYAHRRGVFHGAVKPSNVLLDEEGNAYLADFSVAAGGTRSDASVATDVHAFGLLVHRLLGGTTPLEAGALPRLSDVRDDVPVEVDGVLARATASEPGDRYSRMEDLLRDLRRVLGADVVGAAAQPSDEQVSVRNPYKGLRAFHEMDAGDFFGRDDESKRLQEALVGHRLVAVVGPSGSGKSSLVRAALIPSLRQGGLPGSESWLITDMYPGAHPFEELAAALSRVAVERIDGLFDDLIADERGLLRVSKQALPGEDTQLLIVIDQFEELFSMVGDPAVRRLFLDSLTVVASDPRGRVRIVITLRADFFDRPLEHHDFGALLEAGLLPLTVPSEEGLALAISRPARSVGLDLEPGLVAEIVRDVKGQPGGLPLMQHTLAELARRRRNRLLTFEAYLEAGGVAGALGNRAEELYGSLKDAERRAAEEVFLRLVAVNEAAEDTRRRVRLTELAALDIDPVTLDRVLSRFGAHRLVSFDRDPVTRGATVEVAHEALLQGWGRLRGWIADRRDELLLRRRLHGALREWEDADHDPAFLLSGGRLQQFQSWAAAAGLPLTAGERQLLSTSRAQEDAARKRRRRRRRGLTAAMALLTAASVVLAIVAVDRVRTVQVRSLLTAATTNLESDPELALSLAIEAAERARGQTLSEAAGVLHDTLLRAPVVRGFPGTAVMAWNPTTDRIAALSGGTDHGRVSVRDGTSGEEVRSITPGYGGVTGLSWSADGRLLAITSEAGPALVWDVANGRTRAEIPPSAGGHHFPSFGADDTLLALSELPGEDSFGRTDTVVIWDVERNRQLRRLMIDTEIYGTHMSPVEPLLLVSEPETFKASIWDVRTGEKAIDLGDQGYHNDLVRFSPDGGRAAVLGRDRLKVWSVPGRELIAELTVGTGAHDMEWSPDGALIATAGTDAVVRLYDVETQTEVRTIRGAGTAIDHVEFGPNGRELAALWDDIRIWGLHQPAGMEIAAYPSERPIIHAAWTPDRSRVVTIGSDSGADVVEVVDATSGTLLASIRRPTPDTPPRGPRAPPAKIAVSPDGRIIAATVHGTSTLIIDAATLEPITVLQPGGMPGAFSADSRRLIVGDFTAAYVYDTQTWDHTATVRNRDPSPLFTWYYDAAFHPERDVVFVADSNNADRSLTVWDVAGQPEKLAQLPMESAATMVALSSDGRRVVAGDVMSGKVRVWDVERVLAGEDPPSAIVLDVDAGEFMPGAVLDDDGSRLITAARGGQLAVWDVDESRRLYTIDIPDGAIHEPELSAEGTRVLVPTPTVVHELTLDLDELLDVARTRVTRPLTEQECRIYLDGDCPTRA